MSEKAKILLNSQATAPPRVNDGTRLAKVGANVTNLDLCFPVKCHFAAMRHFALGVRTLACWTFARGHLCGGHLRGEHLLFTYIMGKIDLREI